METIKCPSCGKLWPENYCPECARTIDRDVLLSLPSRTTGGPVSAATPQTETTQRRKPAFTMGAVTSWLVYVLALGLVPVVLYLAYLCFYIVDTRDAMGSGLFVMVFAPAAFAISVVLVMIPSLVLYRRNRARRDIQSFWISVASSVAVVAEVVIMIALLNGKRLYGPAG